MSRRGSVLVAVLLLASLLAVFIGVAGDRLSIAGAATRSSAEDVAADVAVRGAVEYLWASSAGRLASVPKAVVDYPGLVVEVTSRDEGERIDLDMAAPELIAGLFRSLGVEPERATHYARVIVDWRRDPKARPSARGTPTVPAHGPIEHIRELDRLKEIPPEVVRAMLPFVTVTSLGGRVSVMTAPREVLAALPGMDPSRVEAFIGDRETWTDKFETLIRRYGIVADHVSREGSKATRLTMTVRIGAHRVRGYEVVVAVLPGDSEPYRFLSWNGTAPLPTGAGWR